jgi:hypothetical protein
MGKRNRMNGRYEILIQSLRKKTRREDTIWEPRRIEEIGIKADDRERGCEVVD